MINRWTILAVLFLARTAMAFQFQAVAAMSPILVEDQGLSLTEIGLLIGLYLAPGVIVAVPGSALAQRLGERRIVLAAMGLMLIGSLLILIAPSYHAMMIGRVLAGAGGVVVNIVMTKMLVDWFAGKEISTALAIFVNSWPVGIALALLVLPMAAGAFGTAGAEAVVMAIILAGLIGIFLFYRAPDHAPEATTTQTPTFSWRLPWTPLVMAGLIWAFYNTALAMVFSFGPALFTERGLSPAEAGSLTSGFMFAMAVSIPFGGILADKTGRRDTIIAVACLSFAVLGPLLLILPTGLGAGVLILTAVIMGIGAGPIMTLPSLVLAPEARNSGMGVFFTLYYLVMMIAPRIAGTLADQSGSAGAAFWMGAGVSLAALICLWIFRKRRVLTA